MMRKYFYALSILCLLSAKGIVYSQSAKEMLAEIEGKYEVDGKGMVTYSRIIDLPGLTKDQIYQRALDYFIYNYKDASSVIESKDKEDGVVIGKGIYKKCHVGQSLTRIYIDTWHILRVEAKDNKARITLSLTEYDLLVGGVNGGPPSSYTARVSEEYPINSNGSKKNIMGKAFYKSHELALASIDAVEKSIREDSDSKNQDAGKWR